MSRTQASHLAIHEVAITALKPDPANPRSIPEPALDALVRSIEEFGLVDPIIARKAVSYTHLTLPTILLV